MGAGGCGVVSSASPRSDAGGWLLRFRFGLRWILVVFSSTCFFIPKEEFTARITVGTSVDWGRELPLDIRNAGYMAGRFAGGGL